MNEQLYQLHLIVAQKVGQSRSCGKKTGFSTEEKAERAANAHNAWAGRRHNVEPYPCPFCKNWHIGRVMPMEILQVIAKCFERSNMDILYEGKAKILYQAHEPDQLVQYFKDDATAFNGEKKGTIADKGIYNCAITSRIFKVLKEQSIPNHFIGKIDERTILTEKATLIPLEVVVRNRVAGSLSKRLGMAEGTALACTVLEFYYKNDMLGDPMINEDHIAALQLPSPANDRFLNTLDLGTIKHLAHRVNQELQPRFLQVGLELVDFKLEFGITRSNNIILIDEITPDSCRLWDVLSGEKMDKDRFRRDLGKVEESYKEVHDRVLSDLF